MSLSFFLYLFPFVYFSCLSIRLRFNLFLNFSFSFLRVFKVYSRQIRSPFTHVCPIHVVILCCFSCLWWFWSLGTDCPSGQSSSGGSTACTPSDDDGGGTDDGGGSNDDGANGCSAGQFQSVSGTCSACPEGTYQVMKWPLLPILAHKCALCAYFCQSAVFAFPPFSRALSPP